jgi:hypothetical protein
LDAVGCALSDAGDVKHAGRATQHLDGGLLRFRKSSAGVLVDSGRHPFQVVDHPHQGLAACRQADRSEVGVKEVNAQCLHRPRHLRRRPDAFQPIGQRTAHLRRVPPQLSVVPRRKKEQRCRHADDQCDCPTQQTLADGSGRSADRQHVGQQRHALPRGDRLAEDTGQRHCDTKGEHQHHRQPRQGSHQGADRDQNSPVETDAAMGECTSLSVSREVEQHHQPQGADDREQRSLRATRDDETHRGRKRNDDRRPDSTTQRIALRILPPQPFDHHVQQAGRHQCDPTESG